METFIKKYIKSEDDLPKEEGKFIAKDRLTKGIFQDWSFNHSEECKLIWLNNIDWYLSPCPELVELINIQMELLNAYRHGREHPVKWWNEKYDRIAQLRKEVGI